VSPHLWFLLSNNPDLNPVDHKTWQAQTAVSGRNDG